MAGGGGFNRLDTVYFQDAIREMEKGSELFGEAKDAIDRKTKALKGCWEGKGGDQFKKSYKRLKEELDAEHETLEDMIKELKTVYKNYVAWDTEQAAQLKSLASDSASQDVKSSK